MRLILPDGSSYSLDYPEVTIGRGSDNMLVLQDPSVSSRHAIIRRDGAACLLTDVGSSNGTYVNGQPAALAQRLAPGDTIQLGNTALRVENGGTMLLGSQQPAWNAPNVAYASPVQQPYGMPASGGMIPYGAYMPVVRPKDRAIALILEILPGLFGFMGFGWMYADQIGVGLALLLGMWVFLCVQVVVAMATLGISLFCTLPLQLVLVIGSAALLYNHTRSRTDLFGP